jgi:hypothetical protein
METTPTWDQNKGRVSGVILTILIFVITVAVIFYFLIFSDAVNSVPQISVDSLLLRVIEIERISRRSPP